MLYLPLSCRTSAAGDFSWIKSARAKNGLVLRGCVSPWLSRIIVDFLTVDYLHELNQPFGGLAFHAWCVNCLQCTLEVARLLCFC